MKLGVFLTQYPYPHDMPGYFTGGTGHVAHLLTRDLVALGHSATVFTTSHSREFSDKLEGSVRVLRYPRTFQLAQTLVSVPLAWRPAREEMDLAHAHAGNPPATIAAYRAKKRQGIPLVITYHGDFQSSYGSVARRAAVSTYTKWFRQRMLPAADAIICPSRYFVDDSPVLRDWSDRVTVIPNGIDLATVPTTPSREASRQLIGLSAEDVVIAYLGSLVPYKGPDVLVRAFANAARGRPNLKLLIMGSGPLRENLEGISAQAGLANQVRFLGPVSDAEKWNALRASDIFCLPSTMRTENFPIVLLEAQAAGLALVTSDLPTFKSMVEEKRNGLSSRLGDPDSLAEALIHLADDSGARRSMAAASLEMVRRFASRRIAEETANLFAGLIR